jgi:hypothetical protein
MTRLCVSLLILGTLTISAPAWADESPAARRRSINEVQHRQRHRVHANVAAGNLTAREVNRLLGEQAAIRAEERVYRRSGDELSRWERHDLRRDLRAASRHIYRQSHDRQSRR